VSEFKYLEV